MALTWSTSCPDWEARLLAGRPLVPELPLFRSEADKAIRIFGRLKLPDVIGTPTLAEATGPWMLAIVEALFGAYDPTTHRRMIQEFFLLIPKKNGKSSVGGALMVTALITNRRPEAEFLLVAPTKEIADIAFKQASGTIRIDPQLTKLFHIQRHIRTITHRRSNATLKVVAADTDAITGLKAQGTVIDETHAFASKSRAADVFLEIRGAMAARPDGFLIQITTQSKEPPSGVFKAELQMARDVRDGKIALPLLPVLYELPAHLARDGGWKDRKYWPLINPNMGRSVDEEFLDREMRKAEAADPHAMALLASQHFNVEIGLALMSDRWAGADFWERQGDKSLTLDEFLRRSEVCIVGIDGGGLDDLFGLAVLGRDRDSKTWLLWSHGWCHVGVLDRRKSIASKLRDFEAAGELTIVSDALDDLTEIVGIVERIKDADLLHCVAIDPAGVGEVVDELARIDVSQDAKNLIGVVQGWRLMPAMKTAERRLAHGTLQHNGSGLMGWNVSNVRIEATATAIRATKANAGDAKIDCFCAAMNAVDRMIENPEAAGSIYCSDDRPEGLIVLNGPSQSRYRTFTYGDGDGD